MFHPSRWCVVATRNEDNVHTFPQSPRTALRGVIRTTRNTLLHVSVPLWPDLPCVHALPPPGCGEPADDGAQGQSTQMGRVRHAGRAALGSQVRAHALQHRERHQKQDRGSGPERASRPEPGREEQAGEQSAAEERQADQRALGDTDRRDAARCDGALASYSRRCAKAAPCWRPAAARRTLFRPN